MAVVETLPFQLELVQPKAPLVRNGTIELKVVVTRAEGFTEPITVEFPFRSPGVAAVPNVKIPADKSEVEYTVNADGKAVFRIEADGSNLSALTELFGQVWPEPFMVQPFLPEVAEGDKRIVLVDGEVLGAINRKPGEGEFRSNLAVGGYAEKSVLTEREAEICAAMGPDLKARGLVFVGIDVIGGKWLTEINVTSPTGIVAIENFDGTDTGGAIWDAIERRLKA